MPKFKIRSEINTNPDDWRTQDLLDILGAMTKENTLERRCAQILWARLVDKVPRFKRTVTKAYNREPTIKREPKPESVKRMERRARAQAVEITGDKAALDAELAKIEAMAAKNNVSVAEVIEAVKEGTITLS
jgi:hypothetical protein